MLRTLIQTTGPVVFYPKSPTKMDSNYWFRPLRFRLIPTTDSDYWLRLLKMRTTLVHTTAGDLTRRAGTVCIMKHLVSENVWFWGKWNISETPAKLVNEDFANSLFLLSVKMEKTNHKRWQKGRFSDMNGIYIAHQSKYILQIWSQGEWKSPKESTFNF